MEGRTHCLSRCFQGELFAVVLWDFSNTHFDPESMLFPEDVSVDQHQSPSLLCVKLKHSKTDPLVIPGVDQLSLSILYSAT